MDGTFKNLNLNVKVPTGSSDLVSQPSGDLGSPGATFRSLPFQNPDWPEKDQRVLTSLALSLCCRSPSKSVHYDKCPERLSPGSDKGLIIRNPSSCSKTNVTANPSSCSKTTVTANPSFCSKTNVTVTGNPTSSETTEVSSGCQIETMPRFSSHPSLPGESHHVKRQTSGLDHPWLEFSRKSPRTLSGDAGQGDVLNLHNNNNNTGWRPKREFGGGGGGALGGELRRVASGELKRTGSGDSRKSPKADSCDAPSIASQLTLRRLPSATINLGGARKELACETDNGDGPVGHEGSKIQQSGPLPDEPVVCRVACQSRSGRKNGLRKPNQDAYCFMRSDDRKCLIFGVFDGHGPNGKEAALFVKEHLPASLMKQPNLLTCPADAFAVAFSVVHKNLEPDVECSVSGTTAVVAQIFGRILTVAWAGDSRAVLARTGKDGSLEAMALTIDHKPDNVAERQRIMENDGRVDRLLDQQGEEVGPYRVWLRQSPFLGLAMSRSLGDCLAHSVGVIPQPEVISHELQEGDKFLILASDGVWEWISSDEAVEIVGYAPSIEAGCKNLMQAARARWQSFDHGSYVDDITAMVIGFTHRQNISIAPETVAEAKPICSESRTISNVSLSASAVDIPTS